MKRIKQHALNLVLAAGSFAGTYVLIGFIFFHLFLPYVSLNLMTHLPDTAGVLVQNSKSGFVPHDYIALLGDSYAEGVGDWLWEAHGNRTKPFHSGNVIHEATGRDVVSFGREGAGSAEAIVLQPARIFGGTGCYLFPNIEPPRDMVIYFYEGNDIDDNIHFLENVNRSYGQTDERSVDRLLVEDYASVSAWKCHGYLADTMARMAKFLFQYYVAGITFEADLRRENTLLVARRQVMAPPLNGPALLYDDNQIRAGMGILGRSLAWLKQRFPGVTTTVAYIPSPLSIYQFATDAVRTTHGRQPGATVSLAFAGKHSDLICRLARQEVEAQGAGFLDTRPALRAAAATRVIHGPIDWFHLNESGYRVLGELVVDGLQARAAANTCGDTAH